MKKILTARQMKECDHSAIAHGTPSAVLMQRAGNAVYEALISNFDVSNTLIVCGSGNNGGDGFIVALCLKRAGYSCEIWYVGAGHAMTEETERRYYEAVDEGIPFVEDPHMEEYTAIVDAIFGIGLSSDPGEVSAMAIEMINNSLVPVISVDIPSGISSDTGHAYSPFVRADMTVTMEAYKRGHSLFEGIDASGKIICADLGIDTSYAKDADDIIPFSITNKDLSLIPRRRRDSHKGDFGRILVIGGSIGMCGAAFLSAFAAYRSGAGIVEIYTPEANRAVMQTLLPEAIVTSYSDVIPDISQLITVIERASVIVIGPGLGTDERSRYIVRKTFELTDAPIIVDADALNITASDSLDFPTDVPVIVTPHPGELSRLTKKSIRDLSNNTWKNSMSYAKENDVICVSKFARTVITDGERLFVNMSGGPSLSKGGSGDVLTGIIAGMLACGLSPIDAAAIGVYVHGCAGDIAAQEMGDYSPLARDVINSIPKVLKNAGGHEQWQ